ncbi:MAG: C10 family peptidase [Bacteroidales bacterium]|nr:C10 family peptidase [Bacteroidales bacterium]
MKKAIYPLFLATLTAVLATTSRAEPVSPQKAKTAAATFLWKANTGIKHCGVPVDTAMLSLIYAAPQNDGTGTAYYVFTHAETGWVMVAGDDAATPIIAYSYSGTYRTKEMPDNISAWLRHYVDEISDAAHSASTNAATAAKWRALLEGNAPIYEVVRAQAVPAMMTTTWSQSPYYNSQCPYDNAASVNAVTGCVATATAQIMKYWNHPPTGYGSHSYVEDDYGTLTANFGVTSYNWPSMPNALTASSTTTEIDAVATLMSHIGIADEMDYSTTGSGAQNYSYNGKASTPSSQNALINYFKYAPDIQAAERSHYTDNEFCNILYDELAALRPILFSGSHETSGHSFVLDGSDLTGLFHINWGWGGYCDGYYAIGNLNPNSSGTGGNSANSYNERNVALIGIRPNPTWGTSTSVSVLSAMDGFATGGGTYPFGDTAIVEAYANEGYRFSHWSSGGTLMPRSFVATGGSYSFTPVFEPLGDDTVSYCGNGNQLTSLGGSGTKYWGMRIPASSLTSGHQLTAAQLYVRYAGTYNIVVYEGTTSPTTQIYTATMYFTDDNLGWNTFALTIPHTIDATKSLWITFNCSDVSYPATMAVASGNGDGLLWGNNFQSIYSSWKYTFMIRALMSDPTAIPMVTVSNVTTSTSGDGTCSVTFTTTPNAATTEYDVWCFNDNLYSQIENFMVQYHYDLSIIYLLTMGGEPIYPHFQGTATNSWTRYNLTPNTGYHIITAAKSNNDTTYSETFFLSPMVGGTGLATIACSIDSVTDNRAYFHTTMGDQTAYYYMFHATSEMCSIAYPNAQAVIDSGLYNVMSSNFNGYYNNLLPNTQYEMWLIPFNQDSVQGTPLQLAFTTTQSVTRIVLVEQFTNQSMGLCGTACNQAEAALAGQENYIWISHHLNFWSDSLTNPASNALSWFFGPSGGYLPSIMYDRTNFNAQNTTPMNSVGDVASIQNAIEQARNVHCSLILNADNIAYNVDTRTVNGAIEGQFLQATYGNRLRITIYVVEDSIYMSQSVFSDGINSVEPNYLHRNVVREAVSSHFGDPINPASDGTFSYALNFTLNSNYNAAHTYIVAFVCNYDSTDINAFGIYNAAATGFLGPYVGNSTQPEVTVSVSYITDSSATVTFDVDDDSHPFYAYVDVNNAIYNYIASHLEDNTTEEEAFDVLKNSSWLRYGDYIQNVTGLFPGTEYSIYTKVYANSSDSMGIFSKTTFTTRNSGGTAHVAITATPDTNAAIAVFHPNNACTQYYTIASFGTLHSYLAGNGFNSIEEMIRQRGILRYGDDTVSYYRIRGGAAVHIYTLALTEPNDFGNVDSAIVVIIPRGGTGTATMNITVSNISDTSAHVHYAAGDQTESFYVFYTTRQESSVDSMIALVSDNGWNPSYGNGGDWYPSNLTPNTTYYVWALPYNLNGELGTYTRVPFTTLGTPCYVSATCDTVQGYVTGGGAYRTGDTILLQAFAHVGFRFTQWNDGNTNNPRAIVVTGNATYNALFEQENYNISVNCDSTQGTVSGGGSYLFGDTLLLTATANTGYRFKQWNDGDTNNPRAIVVTGDAIYTAFFESNTSINTVKILHFSLNPNPARSFVTLSTNVNASSIQVVIFDMTGRRMLETSLSAMQTTMQIDITSLPQGSYIVRVESNGIQTHKKLIVQ